jgi:flagellar protein FliS
MFSNGIQGYQRTSVITADPKRLVLMCYEGAIDNLKIVKQRIKDGDYEGKGKAIIKVQAIISELQCSLDMEKGGLIAKNLDSLYNYMLRRIIGADLSNDIPAVDEVIQILEELNAAWEEAFRKPEKKVGQIPLANTKGRNLVSNYINA